MLLKQLTMPDIVRSINAVLLQTPSVVSGGEYSILDIRSRLG